MEYHLGKAVDKTIRLLYSRRIKKWGAEIAPFTLRPELGRFQVVATFLAEKEVRVVDLKCDTPPRPYLPVLAKMAHPATLPEYGFGWSDSETIFLPVKIADMPTSGDQEILAKLLLFFLSAQIKHGSLSLAKEHQALLSTNRALADTYWIIENSRLFHLMDKEFPGLFGDYESISIFLAGRRPGADHLRACEQKVEEFFLELLKAALSRNSMQIRSPQESFVVAGEQLDRWKEEGVSFKRYRAFVPFTPWGRLLPDMIKEGARAIESKEVSAKEKIAETTGKNESADEKKERSRYMTTSESVDEEACEQGIMLNIYDKVLSWADFVNVSRPFDDDPDDSDLDKRAEEMEEITTAEITRQAGSTFNADLEKSDDHLDTLSRVDLGAEKVFLYPEWDYLSKSLRDDHSRLVETEAEGVDNGFVAEVLESRRGIIKEVRRKFEMLTPEVRLTNRQFEGDQIDIDAVVEAMADFEAGGFANEKLYMSSRSIERDLSVLFLVDLSMSTDAWVKNRRVIDHEKESLVVLCEVMEALKDSYAIYGFSGKTRKACRYFHIKGFDEDYNDDVKRRIGGLIPYQYTRMGPAIRHSVGILKKQSSRSKLLFIISDGKPNDMDAYEGKYGIEDTRMAIKGAEKDGVIPFCLTVDSRSHEYLPRVFGRGNYAVLAGIDSLSKKLPEFYGKIIRNL